MSSHVRPLAVLVLAIALLAPVGAPARRASADDVPTAEAVDQAIERGVTWLAAEQRADGTWGNRSRAVGNTVLAVYALLHAGVYPEVAGTPSRALTRGLAWLARHGPGQGPRRHDAEAGTYETSLLILMERALGRGDGARVRRLVPLLEASQATNGQWSYAARRGPRGHDAGDNSNTQFAVLALGAAVGEGVEVKADVLRRAWAWWRSAAQTDGGFGYSSGGSRASASIGSMTAAGVSSLAILEAALAGRVPGLADDETPTGEILDAAVQRLAKGFSVKRNFGPSQGRVAERQRHAGRGWIHYFLWSVERAMVLGGHEKLGTTDWYAAGATELLETQARDGSWRGEHPLYATAFALLFLTRAADPPRVFTPPDGAGGPLTAPDAMPPDDEPDAPPPGTVREWLERPLAPDALQAACRLAGAECLGALVRALDHPEATVRQRAHETLLVVLGTERVGRAALHPLARGRLRLWTRVHRRRLILHDGRFILP